MLSSLLLSRADCDRPLATDFLGAVAVAFTRRSPSRETCNEDALGVFEWNGKSGVLAVADGLGGLPRGEEASERVVQALAAAPRGGTLDPLCDRVGQLNGELIESDFPGGTMLAAAVVRDGVLTTHHVGDSAVLVVGQRGRVRRHTVGHSPVDRALRAGRLSERDALFHPERHLVGNMVGDADMWVESGRPLSLGAHDTVLLATDGLWDNFYLAELVDVIKNGDLLRAAVRLVDELAGRMRSPGRDQPGKADDVAFVLYRPGEKGS